jgi:hypothetical protein
MTPSTNHLLRNIMNTYTTYEAAQSIATKMTKISGKKHGVGYSQKLGGYIVCQLIGCYA